jgi:hypothetical protein
VLEHVHREVVLLGDAVERADERCERDGEPEAEQQCAVPAGEVGPAAATEADRRLGEKQRPEGD